MRSGRFNVIIKKITDFTISRSYLTKAIQITVIILVLLIALQDNPSGPLVSIVIILWTIFCINTLRVFSEIAGHIVEERRLFRPKEKISVLYDFNFIVIELIPVILIFVIAWIGLIDINTAYEYAKYILISIMFIYGYVSLKLTGKNVIICILGGILYTLIGLSLVFIRSIIS